MQIFQRVFPVLALALTLAPAFAQDPLQELRQYDYQNRKPLDAISKQIVAAGKDSTKLAALETGLVLVLQDPQSTLGARLEACTFLSRIGTVRSVPALAKLLADPASANIARLALERNTDPAAGVALQAALGSVTGTALVGTINSLGNRGEVSAVAKLKALTASTDPLVAEAAVTALGKIATPASVAALRLVKNTVLPTAPALLSIAGKLAVAGKRSDALGIYESLLRGNQPEVIRAGALTGLVALNAPRLGALALALARTAPEPMLQRVAGRVLGMLAEPERVKAAVTAFPTLPAPAQIALLAAWSDRKETAAADVTLGALKSGDAEVRVAAIQTAVRVAGVAAVMPLAVLAQEGEHASLARNALARMGGAGVEDALLRLASRGPGKIPPAMIAVLGERPTVRSTTQLVTIAGGQEQETRVAVAALKVLEKTATPAQTGALVSLLVGTSNDMVRDAAQTALVAIALRTGDRERAAQPLLMAMGSASVAGKAALLGALAELGGESALAALTQAATSGDEELKNAALSGLANTWGDLLALPTLLKIGKSSTVKSDRVLAQRGSLRLLAADDRLPAQQKLSQLSELFALAERPEEQRQALSVLREVRLPGAVALATKALDNPELV
ncbi:HEAT repeat domain-containing protein, partial [Armatimonas sp.]|uniref:HEAT repeat domain-containing protein n=1 Tax=Armatimonas sp. TaxID=1872638 RepID=UPI003751A694